MRSVFKYPILSASGRERGLLNLPQGARPVFVGAQGDAVMLWVEVDNSIPFETPHDFRVFGTGHAIPEEATYIGSCQTGPFVWHVYELPYGS